MIHTVLCDLLGIEYPIIQGGMAWVSSAELAAAVSEAGGLGVIGSGTAHPDWLREQLSRARQLTGKPFGVNVMLRSPYVEEIMAILQEEPVAVVTTGAGNPVNMCLRCARWVRRLFRLFLPWRWPEGWPGWRGRPDCRRDGTGGHIGELTTMALVPRWWTQLIFR